MRLNITHPIVYEVGAGDLFSCKSRAWWDVEGSRIVLFEPNPLLYASLLGKTAQLSNVTLHHVAIGDAAGLGYLVNAGVCSYLEGVPSHLNTIFRGKLTPMLEPFKVPVPIMTFDTFDPCNIDVLYLGMEGSEHTVFDHLRFGSSRPHLIILNNHFANDYAYAFPRFEVIQAWCAVHGYDIHPGVPDILLLKRSSLVEGTILP